MIKELFYWFWNLFCGLFTFKYSRISYEFKYLYWYLRYGFAYYNVQDMDQYIAKRFSTMLPLFLKYNLGAPKGFKYKKYKQDLRELKNLCDLIYSNNFDFLRYEKQVHYKNRFLNLLKIHFQHLTNATISFPPVSHSKYFHLSQTIIPYPNDFQFPLLKSQHFS